MWKVVENGMELHEMISFLLINERQRGVREEEIKGVGEI